MCCFRIGALRGEKHLQPRPQNKTLVTLMNVVPRSTGNTNSGTDN